MIFRESQRDIQIHTPYMQWMDRWMDGWMDGRMDRWMDRKMNIELL